MMEDRPGEGTRELILSKARELFLTYGYHKTSMRTIAQAANISTGPLYFHFQNKAEVFFHVCNDAAERLMADYRAAAATATHAGLRLWNIFHAYRDFYYREPQMFAILQLVANPASGIDLPGQRQEALNRKVAGFTLILEELIRDGIARAELRPVNPRALALYLNVVTEGIFRSQNTGVLARAGMELDEMLDAAGDLIAFGMLMSQGTGDECPAKQREEACDKN